MFYLGEAAISLVCVWSHPARSWANHAGGGVAIHFAHSV
jgi:hypothetical protein